MQTFLISFSTIATDGVFRLDESLLLTGLLSVGWIAAAAIAYMAAFDRLDSSH